MDLIAHNSELWGDSLHNKWIEIKIYCIPMTLKSIVLIVSNARIVLQWNCALVAEGITINLMWTRLIDMTHECANILLQYSKITIVFSNWIYFSIHFCVWWRQMKSFFFTSNIHTIHNLLASNDHSFPPNVFLRLCHFYGYLNSAFGWMQNDFNIYVCL